MGNCCSRAAFKNVLELSSTRGTGTNNEGNESDYDREVKKFLNRKREYNHPLNLNLDIAAIEASICYDKNECTHPFLFHWDDNIFCCDCKEELNTPSGSFFFGGGRVPKPEYALRLAQEAKIIENTPEDVIPEGLSDEEKSRYIGKKSQERGVTIGFLWHFTKYFNCWEWTSHDVIRKIVKPLTEEKRCRFVELPEMKDHVGPASTFISYAQAGRWGDVMGAILDGGADLSRCVWLDVFAVRQYPSRCPDLDFASTIAHCSSFMVICSARKEVEEMDTLDAWAGKTHLIPEHVRKMICFMRVWCLVEAQQACKMGIPYIMKCGSYALRDDGNVVFNENEEVLRNMIYLVNVQKAEASVASDRERILQSIEADVGIDKLNSTIRGSIIGGWSGASNIASSLISCAACGDQDALEVLLQDGDNIVIVAGKGYLSLVHVLLQQGADVGTQDNDGRTALMFASVGGHIECVRYLVESGKADVGTQANDGRTALLYASSGSHSEVCEYLKGKGAVEIS